MQGSLAEGAHRRGRRAAVPSEHPVRTGCSLRVHWCAPGSSQRLPKKAAVDTEGRCSRGRGESAGTPERNTLARLPWKRIWRQDLHRGCESIRGYGGAIARVTQNPQWKIQGQEQEMAPSRVTSPCGPHCVEKAHAWTSSHGCGDGAHAPPDSQESQRISASTQRVLALFAHGDKGS